LKFYLGLHQPSDVKKINVPIFLSVKRLIQTSKFPDISGIDAMLDSGGFTELTQHGEYTITEEEYVTVINRVCANIAYCQDWMCEANVIKKTGLDIYDHQLRTLYSYLSLQRKSAAIVPVLQGWDVQDYVEHARMHKEAGVDLTACRVVGVGTLCRRSVLADVIGILKGISDYNPDIKLHGFGLKTSAMARPKVTTKLYSADSMAWCMSASNKRLDCDEACEDRCSNCLIYALNWRMHVIKGLPICLVLRD